MRSPQAVAVAVALVIGVLLFIAPRIPVLQEKGGTGSKHSFRELMDERIGSLSQEEKKVYSNLVQKGTIEELRGFWTSKNDPLSIGLVQAMFAERKRNTGNWMLAGKDFYRAAVYLPHDQRSLPYQLAIRAFDEVLKLDPGHKEGRLKKAVCLVEQKEDPMKGVSLLLDLVKEDSTNIDAQLQLGFFSLQSNQWEKAEERFKKVLQTDSSYIDAWLYLAQTQEMKGEKEQAIREYEKYHNLVKDTIIRNEVRKYIEKIKNN